MAEIEYMDERDAYERVGEMEILDIQDPIERFKSQVDATCRNLNNWQGIKIQESDIITMINMVSNLPKAEYKNAACYVLGYLATNGGDKIEQERVKYVFKTVLPHVEKVAKPDVIRYARLWLNLDKY